MALAVGRAEAALGERQERLSGIRSRTELLAIQLLERDPLHERMRRIEQRADHVVFGIAEARVVEAHPLRPAARKISTFDFASPGAGSAGRASCR